MNNKLKNLTKLLQFDDSEPLNLTLFPEPESYEPMETAPPQFENDKTQRNWWDKEISLLCCNCSEKIY